MKKLLAIVLMLATAFCMMVPVHGLGGGDTIYLVADGVNIVSAKVTFLFEADPASDLDMTDPDGDGVYTVIIPDGATSVAFQIDTDPQNNTVEGRLSFVALANCEGNTYDAVNDIWYPYGSAPEETTADSETTGEPDLETTPETTPETESGSSDGLTGNAGQNSTTITVSGTVGTPNENEVISVDVSWDAMEFTYTPASAGTWDPSTHTYTDGTAEGSWDSEKNAITVTNHSNVDVTASFGFAPEEDLDVTGEFRDGEGQAVTAVNLPSADNGQNGEPGTASEERVTFHITGGSIQSDTPSLGTITVAISKSS